MAESDWDTVTVLRKKGPTAAQAKSKQAILAAQRRGEDVETSKKWAAGQNKQHSITKNTAKLDRETEELHHDRVTLEVGKVIQQGRQSKGLTQKDLATKINEKPQVIADYESGRAIPNNQVLGKIERAIGECPRVLHRVSAAARPGAEQLKHWRASEAAGFCRALGSSGVSLTIPPPRQFHIFSVPFGWPVLSKPMDRGLRGHPVQALVSSPRVLGSPRCWCGTSTWGSQSTQVWFWG
ncbi:unnamed protein product [Nyctereutes procyonoides]|uniref:Endothelial differentiation-related factor 1 n=1 Tax=Nyctereutes procyonoides TaxID=34880 RepID=A0A811XWI6_NYCPR|nr:unnamed protein product [Nyctereutes procyonoides]